MAWEWAGPAATALVGIAGITGTVLSGNRQGRAALEAARQQFNGQLALAQEERRQRRIDDAYRDLLAALVLCDEYAEAVFSATMEGGVPNDVEAPEVFAHGVGADGAYSMYWSPRVRQLMDETRAALRALNRSLLVYHVKVTQSDGSDGLDDDATLALINELVDHKARAEKAITDVRDEMSGELNPGAPSRHLAD